MYNWPFAGTESNSTKTFCFRVTLPQVAQLVSLLKAISKYKFCP